MPILRLCTTGMMVAAAACLMVAGGGCPVVPSPSGEGPIDSLTSSDALVGGRGRLRVELLQPASERAVVALRSSNPDVAKVPESVTVDQGSSVAEVEYDALASGVAQIEATLGESAGTAFVNVVSDMQVVVWGTDRGLQTGATGSVYVELSIVTPHDVVVDLVSSDPAVVSVPPSVTIQEFYEGDSVPVTGGAPGTALITATLNGSSRSVSVQVGSTPAVASMELYFDRLVVGGRASFTVSSDLIVAADTIVTLSSSSPGVLKIPATVTIPAGDPNASEQFTAVAVGSTVVTAQIGASTRAVLVTVVDTVALDEFYVNDNRAALGVPLSAGLYVDAFAETDTVVALQSSNTAVINVPASVAIPSGQNYLTVPLTSLSAGSTVLTATVGASSMSQTVTITDGSQISSVSVYPPRLLIGTSAELSVELNGLALTETVVSLSSSDPAVAFVPAATIVRAGDLTSIQNLLHAVAPGHAVITATAGGSTSTVDVNVVAAPTLRALSFTSRAQTGWLGPLNLSTDVAPTADTPITLSSSDPAVIGLPPTVMLQAGEFFLDLPVLAGTPGDTVLTASLGGTSLTVTTTVVAVPSIENLTLLPFGGKYQVGVVGSVMASLDAAPAGDVAVTLTTTGAGSLSRPSSLLFTSGTMAGSGAFAATAPGAVTLTASAFGTSRTASVEVVTGPSTLSMLAFVPPAVGGSGTIMVTVDCVLANNTTISLSQTDPAALSIPASVVIPAGATFAAVEVTGRAAMPTTITATLGTMTDVETITPVP